jgi:hypothetical protein
MAEKQITQILKKKLGFLSTEDAEAPGNYGLLDQTMALR